VLCLSKHAQYQSLWSTPSCAISVGSFALYRSFQILNLFVAFLLCICMKLKSTTQQRYASISDIHWQTIQLCSPCAQEHLFLKTDMRMIKQNNYQYSLFVSIIFNVSFQTSTFVWPQRNNIIAAQHSMHNLNLISKQIIWHKFKQFSTTCNFKVLWKKIEPTEGSMSNKQLRTKTTVRIIIKKNNNNKKMRQSQLSTKNSVNWLRHP